MSTIDDVLKFWFKESQPSDWFTRNSTYDEKIRNRFEKLHAQANRCELWKWRDTPLGRLAEIIVLDQFSRNMFRNDPRCFQSDSLALALAQEAVRGGHDKALTPTEKNFLYLPYMHSESLEIHEIALKLFSQPGLENAFDYEKKHKVILERFGRYPHRNETLGRKSSPEESAFLKEPGSSF